MIPQLIAPNLASPLVPASFNITPNSSLPGSSQVTSFLGGIEQWAVYACLRSDHRRRRPVVGGPKRIHQPDLGLPARGARRLRRSGHHRGRGLPYHLGLQLRHLGQLRCSSGFLYSIRWVADEVADSLEPGCRKLRRRCGTPRTTSCPSPSSPLTTGARSGRSIRSSA
jgi:hypothetical protein